MFASYATPDELGVYLQFHYGAAPAPLAAQFGMDRFAGFHARVVEWFLARAGGPRSRVLDLGCGVGRAAFELSRQFDEVVAIDFSEVFIQAAEALRTQGSLPFSLRTVGRQRLAATAQIPADSRPDALRFQVGDACALPADLGTFDGLLALNLLCRVPAPQQLLGALSRHVRPGGFLLLGTPWSWEPHFTPPEQWIDGAAGDRPPLAEVEGILAPWFEWQATEEIPYFLPQTERLFYWGVSQCSLWRRREELA